MTKSLRIFGRPNLRDAVTVSANVCDYNNSVNENEVFRCYAPDPND